MSPRVAELTVEEKLGLLQDPDEGLEMQPEFETSLQDYLASDRRGDTADDVFKALGLESDYGRRI